MKHLFHQCGNSSSQDFPNTDGDFLQINSESSIFAELVVHTVHLWDKVFKNEPSSLGEPLKNLERQNIPLQICERLSSTDFTWSILESKYSSVK